MAMLRIVLDVDGKPSEADELGQSIARFVGRGPPVRGVALVSAQPYRFPARRSSNLEGESLTERLVGHGFLSARFQSRTESVSLSYADAHKLLRILGDNFRMGDG